MGPSRVLPGQNSKVSVMVWLCGMGALHMCDGTINVLKYIQVLDQHLLPYK